MDHHFQHAVRLAALDLLVMIVCASNIPSVVNRARLPASTVRVDHRTVVAGVENEPGAALLQAGDILLEWNSTSIGRPEHVEFLADLSTIDETVHVTLERDGSVMTVPVSLISFAPSLRFAVVYTLTGFVILSMALFLLLKRPDDPSARALHASLVALGTLTLMTQGAIDASNPISYVHRALLFAGYAMTPAMFLRWALIFPVRRIGRRRWPLSATVWSGVMFAAILSLLHLSAMTDGSPEVFDTFQGLYEWFHLYFAVLIVVALGFLAAGYGQESNADRRAALRWILWGALIGAVPFTLLVVLPQAFGPQFYLAEEVGLVLVLALPLSLTVALLRYHVFHVQVQAYRRLASFVVSLMTGGMAILAGLVLVSLIWEDVVFNLHFDVALTVAVSMVMLQPARTAIRRLLEESLYPTRSQLAYLLKRATGRFRASMSPDQLGTIVLEEVSGAIPGLECVWSRLDPTGLLVSRGRPGQDLAAVQLPDTVRAVLQRRVILGPDATAGPTRELIDRSSLDWLKRQNCDLAVGLHDESGGLLAVLLGRLPNKRRPLSQDETDALLAITSAASESLGRLHLQELVFLEHQERRRSDELSRLKSHFVSSVSHDLRTPLTSISMFAEMLHHRRLTAAKRADYARIILRESDRLGRMVNNVLNFAKIERGTREYSLKELDLAVVIRTAVRTMSAHATAHKAAMAMTIPRRLPHIHGDADALQDVLMNLIGNAIKYSTPPRRVSVEVSTRRHSVELRVRDRGIGIPASELPRIFEPFYRVKHPGTSQIGGAGLGLALVKHTIDAHGGLISITSKVGKGTTVKMSLPLFRDRQPETRNHQQPPQ